MNFYIFTIFFTLQKTCLTLSNYKDHYCIRDCTRTEPLTCVYNWTLETYSTLSRACYDCPNNYTDCFREHCIAADGVLKTIDTVNRQLPGPYIQVCKGDTLIINVHNMLRSERVTSIHWHGLKQKGTPFMDGVGMITQWPIIPHTSFQYKFKANDPGTHFWHAHSGVQRSEGVFGALIIRDKNDTHLGLNDYDLKEHFMILIEWNVNTLQNIYGSYLHASLFGTEHSILINGRGVSLETFYVKKGFRYRFRVIDSAIQNCVMRLSIDEHKMTLIASDGQPIEPLEVDSLVLVSGERYDFVLNADQEKADYWIKVKGEGSCQPNRIFQRAILRYEGSKLTLNSSIKMSYEETSRNGTVFKSVYNSFNETTFSIQDLRHPKDENQDYFGKISQEPDKIFYFNFDIKPIDDSEFHDRDLYPFNKSIKKWKQSVIDDIKFKMPSRPPLLYWDKLPNFCNQSHRPCDDKFCFCTHLIEVKLNELVEFVMIDGNGFFENHPIHLHGHNFAVLGVGKLKKEGYLTTEHVKEIDRMGLLKRNFDRPVVKDTVTMPLGGYAIVRFIADNPGFWMFHCHIDTHSDTGMTILIKVGDFHEI